MINCFHSVLLGLPTQFETSLINVFSKLPFSLYEVDICSGFMILKSYVAVDVKTLFVSFIDKVTTIECN
ncbi:hypothetical protein IKS57_03435 [bacterium]|nr:hypothetical protein [bacterium]